ncbi:MAG: 2,3-bisphosphoglycerate-independent phosphoglycerate mutase [Phycisphaerales bacterium JB037]
MTLRPVVLIIRDGWGENPNPEHDAFNAIKLADTPVDDRLRAQWPHTLVATSGEDVGLPEGTMGNSEVGHMNIGAGRVVYQDSVRISKACREGTLGEVEAIRDSIRHAVEQDAAVHLMGICSDAGVHGLLTHLEALLRVCKELGAPRVYLHLFTDGRDTGPYTGKGFVEQVERFCGDLGVGRIASVVGRYWAMDRDNRWERVKKAYDLLTGHADGNSEPPAVFASAVEAMQHHYDHPPKGLAGDEFTPPCAIGDDWQNTRIRNGDSVIYYNYRTDRPRELCSAFLLPDFHRANEVKPSPDSGERGFDRGDKLELDFVLMTPYSERLAGLARVAFPKPPKMEDILGEWLAKQGLTQFRCAETEKAPHVTFFFNDQRDEAFEGEHRRIIQSPRVATYDLQPAMSAEGVRDAVLERLNADDCEPVLSVNFANGDMVGHTGSLDAAIKACETTDACTGAIVDRVLELGGGAIVTADHGNAEQMWDPSTNAPHTAHTTYPVPLIAIGRGLESRALRPGGRLADIAPTLLEMLGIEQPPAMTGRSLLQPR